MKKFSFRLEKVLNLKKLHEQVEKRELGQTLQKLNCIENELEEAKNLKENFRQEYHGVKREGEIDPIKIRRYLSFLQVLGSEMNLKKKEKEDQNVLVDEAREKVRSAHCQTKIFEKIREVHYRSYRSDMESEMEKENMELSLDRHIRRGRERGSVQNVLLAIGAACFLVTILFFGILFGLGGLNYHKLKLVSDIIRYKKDYSKTYRVLGEKDPYILMSEDYRRLKAIESQYQKLLSGDVDDSHIITKDVLNHRIDMLERMGVTLRRSKTSINKELSEISKQSGLLSEKEEELKAAREAFNEKVSKRKDDKMQKAQNEILDSFNAMDPEDIANVITAGKQLEEIKNMQQKKEAISYAAGYVSKLSSRKRAGILQALGPEWAMAINRYLEQNI